MDKLEEMAGVMYDAYCKAVGGKAFNGDDLPAWKEFHLDTSKQKQINAWIEAASVGYEFATNLNTQLRGT